MSAGSRSFVCDGEKNTCLSCPLPDCVRELCTVNGKFIKVTVKNSREERRAYERAYYYAHIETRRKQIAESQRKRRARKVC